MTDISGPLRCPGARAAREGGGPHRGPCLPGPGLDVFADNSG